MTQHMSMSKKATLPPEYLSVVLDISGNEAIWMAGEENNPAAQDRKLRKAAIAIANQNLIELKRRWEGIDRGR